MQREAMKRRMARVEERSFCQSVGDNKERIQKRIDYLRLHLEELEDILAKEDFR